MDNNLDTVDTCKVAIKCAYSMLLQQYIISWPDNIIYLYIFCALCV